MFIPEYSITPKILKNISTIEYSKAIIESTTILPSWENQLEKEAKLKILYFTLQDLGINLDKIKVKEFLDEIDKNPPTEYQNLIFALDQINNFSKNKEFGENEIKEINNIISSKTGYRDSKISLKPHPEELLARIVQFFEWFQSLDAKETHPIVIAGITKAYLENLELFKKENGITANYVTYLVLKSLGYNFKNYVCLEDYYQKSKRQYEDCIENLQEKNTDYTEWLEYFTEGISLEVSNIKEKVKLLARDTKIAKATGRVRFTQRQERIVEYLQDYGVLQNKDFTKVFPDVSEDSILRDLKILIEKEVVQKSGSTKSSVYELA